ncbi:lysoplasmalogenase-like protein TMEM86A isoform X2 [Thrips palmi]|uniref:lysoplasmalogenase n=1 Tax=Thrips palmi TaxID=161013 RepID=A0A6P8Z8M5_THRPL|nr:lysoplasmalogenase-like protein TMEM86A isoform X2 [Thrips palmi]
MTGASAEPKGPQGAAADDDTARLLKGVMLKLLPFFKAVVIYFVVMPADTPTWLYVLVKVMPVLSLVLFVVLHEGHRLSLPGYQCRFSRRVALALALSAFADALLVWPSQFLTGMFVFVAVHLLYIAAFGFRPLRPALGVALYASSAWAVSFLVPGLKGPLVLAVPLYTAVLVTMLWRAVARDWDFRTLVPGHWFRLCPAVGGMLFVASSSDSTCSTGPSQVLIMTTYYTAQLGMALSILSRNAIMLKELQESDRELNVGVAPRSPSTTSHCKGKLLRKNVYT